MNIRHAQDFSSLCTNFVHLLNWKFKLLFLHWSLLWLYKLRHLKSCPEFHNRFSVCHLLWCVVAVAAAEMFPESFVKFLTITMTGSIGTTNKGLLYLLYSCFVITTMLCGLFFSHMQSVYVSVSHLACMDMWLADFSVVVWKSHWNAHSFCCVKCENTEFLLWMEVSCVKVICMWCKCSSFHIVWIL